MRLLYVSLALSISFSVCLKSAQADTSSIFAKTIHAGNATPETKEALAALAKMYDARDKLKAFHVEYYCDSNLSTKIVGELQKPNKMNLRLYCQSKFLGQIVSDGNTEMLYNATINEYTLCRAPSSYEVDLVDPDRMLNELFAANIVLQSF